MEILTQYPQWFILFCVLAGIIFASALYVKDKLTSDFHPLIKFLISLLRFGAVSVLAFFLLEPLVKNAFIETEKPLVIVAQDNSESLTARGDTAFILNQLPNKLAELKSKLSEDYDVSTISFGSEIKSDLDLTFNEKQTDFSMLFEEIYSRYSNRNIGAVIIGSDGVFTKGSSPLYSTQKLKAPIYTIALGDTTRQRDLLIQDIAHNKLAYLGNKFPMEILVSGNDFKGGKTVLKVTKNGSTVFSKSLSINSEDYQEIIPVILEAKAPGIQKYSVSLSPLQGEITTKNNFKDIFIDVIDTRQKIAIIAAYPHPDVAALKNILKKNESYETDVFYSSEFNKSVEDYNLFIYHQVPDGNAGNSIVNKALAAKIPSLFIWGKETNFNQFNSLDLGYSLRNSSDNFNDVSGSANSGFKTFKLSEEAKALMRKLPPLSVPFGNLETSPGVNTQVFQKVGPIITESPLFSLNEKNDTKIGVISGEGIWRWRLFSHLETGSHKIFDDWFLKSIQYLSNKKDKSLFRVSTKNSYDETEKIVFKGELYNEGFEPILNQEISLTITNQDGDEFPFNFSTYGETYRLDAGILPSGNYSYVANATSGGKKLSKRGQFSISAVIAEQLHTTADHNLLHNLAERNGGKMFLPKDLDLLSESIKSNSEIVPVSFEKKSLTDLINYKWLLGLILAFLCVEWLLRKRNGVY